MRHPDTTRTEAARLFERGATRAEVAHRLGIARSTCSDWHRRWTEGTLLAHRRAGRRPRLPRDLLQRLGRAMLASPRDLGLPGDEWSVDLVVHWIERETGVRYHRGHVPRLLRRMGWLIPPTAPGTPARLRVALANAPGAVHLQLAPRRPRA